MPFVHPPFELRYCLVAGVCMRSVVLAYSLMNPENTSDSGLLNDKIGSLAQLKHYFKDPTISGRFNGFSRPVYWVF
jgi:hypothetical protein